MQEVIEKILEMLEGKIKCEEQNAIKANKANAEETINLVTAICAFADRYRCAKEIVQEVAEEYNGGWIPCEKELPTVTKDYLVTKMCENGDGPIYQTAHEIFYISDNKWDCERDEYCEWKVIAWQDKIKPYIPESN